MGQNTIRTHTAAAGLPSKHLRRLRYDSLAMALCADIALYRMAPGRQRWRAHFLLNVNVSVRVELDGDVQGTQPSPPPGPPRA